MNLICRESDHYWRYIGRFSVAILVAMLISGCGESEAEREAKLEQERAAMRAAINYDKDISDQNSKQLTLGELFFGASDETVANYVRNLKRTPLEGCPENFQQAYHAHIEAWESRNRERIKATWMDVIAIARLHGVAIQDDWQ